MLNPLIMEATSPSTSPLWTQFAYPAPFQHVSVDQGLSQNTVFCALQDRQGFLWFGTEDGLNRYDGNHFTIYRHSNSDPKSIPDNTVTCLFEDSHGALWIGTFGGLCRFDQETHSFQSYFNPADSEALNSSAISAIAEDAEGNLWIGTAGEGVALLPKAMRPPAQPKFRYFTGPDVSIRQPGTTVTSLFVDRQHRVWAGFEDGGLCQIKHDVAQDAYAFEHHKAVPAHPDASAPTSVTSIQEDALGVLWLGSPQGLFSFMPGQGRFHRYQHRASDAKSLSQDIVHTLYRDRAQTLWIGTDGGGLDKMLPRQTAEETPSFAHFPHDPKNPLSLSSSVVECIYEDRSGVLWVGSLLTGLNKLILNLNHPTARDQRPVKHYRFSPSDPASLSGNMVNAIQEDRYGNLWIGTDGTGFNRVIPPRYPSSPLRFEHFLADPKRQGALQDNAITCMYLDSNQQLWAGSFTGGLIRIDLSSPTAQPRFTHFRKDPKNISSNANFVVSIFEDHAHRFWVATVSGSLDRFDPRTGTYQTVQAKGTVPPSFNATNIYYAIQEDAYGTLWLGNPDGLDRFNPETGEFKIYRVDDGAGALSYPFVNALHLDRAGTLWAGTNGGGLNRTDIKPWDGPRSTFASFGVAQGLSSNTVRGILEDEQGQLWLGTNQGLCHFDPKTGKSRPFIWQEELSSMEFLRNAYYRDTHGELFFGGNKGFCTFRPGDIAYNTVIAPLVITDFKVLNRSMPIHGVSDVSASIPQIEISHKDYLFSFDFAALHFVAPERNQYAFMMEGLDRDWNYVGAQHTISYTTLPAGTYIFKAKGSNCDGVWGQPIRLKVHVLPPWWKTIWFRILLGTTLAGLVYLLIRGRINALRKRNRLLESMVERRTQELATALGELAEANEALRNQSLTDPLTGLRNRRFLDECLPEDIAQVQRSHRDIAMERTERVKLNIDVLFIMIDVDHFKAVNDHYGHHAGDLVLQQLSEILRNAARGSDTVARWGGEEFLVVARNTARADAHILPERIRTMVEAHAFEIGEGRSIHCTCSLGFSVFPFFAQNMDQFSWDQLIDMADQCLYAAKRNGRNAWIGVVPDVTAMAKNIETMPKVLSHLIETQPQCIITSLDKPIHWELETEA